MKREKAKFETEIHQLAALKKRFGEADSDESLRIEEEYERILNKMLDEGLDAPVDQSVLIDTCVLGDRYLNFLEKYIEEHPITFLQFFRGCRYVCIARQLEKITNAKSEIAIEVSDNLRDGFWRRLSRREHTTGVMNQFAEDPYNQVGQSAIFFLNENLNFWDGLGRMPVLSSDGGEVVFWGNMPIYLCFPPSPMEKFWPAGLSVREVNTPLRKHWLIPLEGVKSLVKKL